jgi:hypothetical protein
MTEANMDIDRLRFIFFPYTDERSIEAKTTGRRFVYYTTAETGYKIIKHREIWLRGTSTMNDYLEAEHGFECLNAAYKSESGIALQKELEPIFPGLTEQVVVKFNEWLPRIRQDTYITCLSEHLPEEDLNGRLSMWRAYGGNAGIAMVINGGVLFLKNESVRVSAHPVAYWTQEQMETEFRRIAERIREHGDEVRALDRTVAEGVVFQMFRFAMLCTKHPGFSEEREWRIIACPAMLPSPLLTQAVEVIRGVPQAVQKLTFANHADLGIIGLEIHEVLNRLIIGPCEYPNAIWKALHQLLLDGGIPNPECLIYASQIPLRHAVL